MTLLDDVKIALRVSSDFYNTEINDLIDAGKSDLRLAGISFTDETDAKPLDSIVKRAVITYCKANFGYDNPEAERFLDSYVMLKQHLCLAGEFQVGDVIAT